MFNKKEYDNKWRRDKRKNNPEWRFRENQKAKERYHKNRQKHLEYNELHKDEKNRQQRELARKTRLQILCMNCNFAKGKIGKCPHTKTSISIRGGMMIS